MSLVTSTYTIEQGTKENLQQHIGILSVVMKVADKWQ